MPVTRKDTARRIAIIVLGDIGRSPRMQYHALSFARSSFKVTLIGYAGSAPHADVAENENISIHHMPEPPTVFQKLPGSFMLKALWQALVLLVTCLAVYQPSCFLLQNPPGVPALPVVWLAAWLRGARFAVDWHNYGFSILQLKLAPSSGLVRLAKGLEFYYGRKSHINLCVTRAMQRDLLQHHHIYAHVLYDRPDPRLHQASIAERHQLFSRLAKTYSQFALDGCEEGNVFTNSAGLREDRPALLLSSTSWTEDEDFSILLEALDEYERVCSTSEADLPRLVCVITGKGPLKQHYQSCIAARHFRFVQVCTPWLEAEDYPRLVGSADLGVCLHLSSSGLDLPMKVIDMFGCSLPVCAIGFDCLPELVLDGVNGRVFRDSSELSQLIISLLSGFPDRTAELEALRTNLRDRPLPSWHNNWTSVALPLFTTKRHSTARASSS